MHTNRVNILHVADSNAVPCTISHYLILDLFPSGNAPLYQYLTYTGKTKTILKNLSQFILIVGNTAATSAKCICWTKYYRITDGICKCQTIFYSSYHLRCCNRLPDLFHGIFKFLSVLCFTDRLGSSSDQTHIMLF